MPRVSIDQLAARRQQILDDARSCFARHGYEGATVRRLEQSTGLSRGAIFHHFRDKEALFLALAEQDAQRMAELVAAQGLVQVMRELVSAPESLDTSWTATFLEVARRARTDPGFRDRWRAHAETLTAATEQRLARQAAAGTLRDDVPVPVLARYLELVLEGLVSQLAMGLPADDLAGGLDVVLDVVEGAVRKR
ncbi:TetR/AcrR family transcriptional regulator [Pseudonocardia sp. MH-G8]|uniref:TetR/AcrR family transcriptional regulator n=1 Tax=Pseudonocardia sp. MH-G8 TaxID=1854588 RepID=UPI000BA04664|nr:TetR/AcrR family transcriptional regulator [Pseudonocardia sp. MH-G8]OZM78285.1 TetR family transcriptional regulator [Pseudonocardia sp. MH-G8]